MAKEDHISSVLSALDNMRLGDIFCDFKIIVQDAVFDTHRLILAANSGYFKKYFSSRLNGNADSIEVENIRPEEMQQCIEYIYKTKCNFRLESIPKVLEAAQFFYISHLTEDCLRYLNRDLTPESCFLVLNLAKRLPRDKVQKMALKIVQNNLEKIMSTSAFKKLTEREFFSFTTEANPKIYWKAISAYCRGRENIFVLLAGQINFSRFPFHFLLTDVLSDPLTKCGLPTTRLFVVKEIFSDVKRVKDELNILNCFLLKILASDPSFREYIPLELRNYIDEFMKKNFYSIKSKDGFQFLSKENVVFLLESVKVPEEAKWAAIQNWMNADQRRVRSKKMCRELFGTIKVDELPVNFLIEHVCSEDFVKNDAMCVGVVMDRLIACIRELESNHESRAADSAEELTSGGDITDVAESLKNEAELSPLENLPQDDTAQVQEKVCVKGSAPPQPKPMKPPNQSQKKTNAITVSSRQTKAGTSSSESTQKDLKTSTLQNNPTGKSTSSRLSKSTGNATPNPTGKPPLSMPSQNTGNATSNLRGNDQTVKSSLSWQFRNTGNASPNSRGNDQTVKSPWPRPSQATPAVTRTAAESSQNTGNGTLPQQGSHEATPAVTRTAAESSQNTWNGTPAQQGSHENSSDTTPTSAASSQPGSYVNPLHQPKPPGSSQFQFGPTPTNPGTNAQTQSNPPASSSFLFGPPTGSLFANPLDLSKKLSPSQLRYPLSSLGSTGQTVNGNSPRLPGMQMGAPSHTNGQLPMFNLRPFGHNFFDTGIPNNHSGFHGFHSTSPASGETVNEENSTQVINEANNGSDSSSREEQNQKQ